MKFDKAMDESKGVGKESLVRKDAKPTETIKASEKNAHIKDPDKYPKDNMYAWDTGITDRSPTGFPSDINVLKHKEVIGHSSTKDATTYKDYKKGKKGKK